MVGWLTKNNVWLGVVIAALALVPSAVDLLKPAKTEAASTFNTGNRNTTVTAGTGGVATHSNFGQITVNNNGYTPEQYEKGLRDRETVLRREYAALLSLADNRTEAQIEKRMMVEREIGAITDKLANFEASYAEAKASLEEAERTYQELEGQVPAKQLEAAKAAIEQGPEAAYEAYNAIVESASGPIAKAAYQAAKLAKSAIRYPEALKHYRKAAVLDDQNPLYLNELAITYHDIGHYAEAEPLFLESLAIRKKQLGDEHPSVATSLNNLAGLYQAQGRYSEAEPLYLDAIKILEKTVGADHSNTKTARRNYDRMRAEMSAESGR